MKIDGIVCDLCNKTYIKCNKKELRKRISSELEFDYSGQRICLDLCNKCNKKFLEILKQLGWNWRKK